MRMEAPESEVALKFSFQISFCPQSMNVQIGETWSFSIFQRIPGPYVTAIFVYKEYEEL